MQDCFANADPAGLRNAVVSISLRRRDLGHLLSSIEVPTLFVTGSDHRDWTPELARNASRSLPRGSVSVLVDAAYLGPLETPREFISLVRNFWASHPPNPSPDPTVAG